MRGKYRDVILPMTVLRRLDAVLEDSKRAVLDMKTTLDAAGVVEQDPALRQAAGQAFYNTSKFTLRDLRARASRQQLRADFEAYLDGFSPNVQDILENCSDAAASPFFASRSDQMDLGNFSISLAVKDLAASRAFYEKLGLQVMQGEASQGWLIMKGPRYTVGLFQGMFDKNVLTFNPGWDADARPLDKFMDVREIQRRLKAAGVELVDEANEATTGPASCVVVDPDGNSVLIDQHV